jgi:hypothetical protein
MGKRVPHPVVKVTTRLVTTRSILDDGRLRVPLRITIETPQNIGSKEYHLEP